MSETFNSITTAIPVTNSGAGISGEETRGGFTMTHGEEISVTRIEQSVPQSFEDDSFDMDQTPEVGRLFNTQLLDSIREHGIHESFQKLANGDFTPKKDSREDIIDAKYRVVPDEGSDVRSHEQSSEQAEFSPTIQNLLKDKDLRAQFREDFKEAYRNGEKPNIEELAQQSVEKYFAKKAAESGDIPQEILDDPHFQKLYGKHAMDAYKNGGKVSDEKVMQKALEDYHSQAQELKTRVLEEQDFPQNFEELQAAVQHLQGEYMNIRSELEQAQGQISELRDELLVMALILQLMMEEKKKKEEEKKQGTLLELLANLVALLIAEIMVDDEQERKKIQDNVKKSMAGKKTESASILQFPNRVSIENTDEEGESQETTFSQDTPSAEIPEFPQEMSVA